MDGLAVMVRGGVKPFGPDMVTRDGALVPTDCIGAKASPLPVGMPAVLEVRLVPKRLPVDASTAEQRATMNAVYDAMLAAGHRPAEAHTLAMPIYQHLRPLLDGLQDTVLREELAAARGQLEELTNDDAGWRKQLRGLTETVAARDEAIHNRDVWLRERVADVQALTARLAGLTAERDQARGAGAKLAEEVEGLKDQVLALEGEVNARVVVALRQTAPADLVEMEQRMVELAARVAPALAVGPCPRAVRDLLMELVEVAHAGDVVEPGLPGMGAAGAERPAPDGGAVA